MKIKRLSLIIFVFLVEVILLMAAIVTLNSKAAFLYFAVEAVSFVMVLYLIYSRDNPSFKLTWVIIILVFPLFGVFIYLIFGTHYLSPNLRKMIKKSKLLNRRLCKQDSAVIREIKAKDDCCFKNARFLLKTADKPVYSGTSAEILLPGERIYESMLIELKKAKKFIFMEFFIIKQGEMWENVFSILKEKARSGVEVKIIYDDVGCIDRLAPNFKEECEALSIKAVSFNPLVPVLNKLMDYRDHRKIIVIDGSVGFTGGYNIGDEYINAESPYGYWYDGGIKLEGKAVFSFTVMLLDMWGMITGTALDPENYLSGESRENDGYVQPFNDSPFLSNAAEGTYMNLISSAKKYVYITTPYLVCDNEMTVTLCNAAKSGIDVRIITPHVPDKPYVFFVTHSSYKLLMSSGVKIYEYTPGFMHAKMVLSDGYEGLIGSINLDYRSFYQQFEAGVILYHSSALLEMQNEFNKLFKVSQKIEPRKWEQRPLKEKAAEIFFKLFAPLM